MYLAKIYRDQTMILINASTKETLRLLQDFVPIHPPVAVGYLHSYTESKGIRVKSIDQELVPKA